MALTQASSSKKFNFIGGTLKTYTGTDVAANTEFSETVPVDKMWLLLGVSVSLAQGITQTPQPTLIVDDGTNVAFQGFGASSAQDASVTTQYTWAPGNSLTAGAAATVATAPLPEILMGPGFRVRSSTLGIGANSNYGKPTIIVLEYDL
jgi:hypothetical protein